MKENVVIGEDEVRIYPRGSRISSRRAGIIIGTLAIVVSTFAPRSMVAEVWLKWVVVIGVLVLCAFEVAKTFRPEPLYRINRMGILDNITIFGVGWIGWDEIQEWKVYQSVKMDFIGIYLKDPKAFSQKLHYWKRIYITMNLKWKYPPVNFYPVPLGLTAQELMELIQKFAPLPVSKGEGN